MKKVCNKSNFCVGEKVGKKKYRIEAKAIKCNQLCIGNDVGLSIKLPNLSQDIFSLQSNALPASIRNRIVPNLPKSADQLNFAYFRYAK